MARFFKTSEGNLQDDFIFQPNWELAQLALQEKDNKIANQIKTLNLLRDLDIEFWDAADGRNVENIREEYNNRVDNLAMKMQKNLLDITGNGMLLNDLQRDVKKDYETGRIANIQKNAAIYKEFMERLNSLPNPADREIQKRMIDDYLTSFKDSDKKGADYALFSPDELYSQRNLINEYFNSGYFDRLTPTEKSEEFVTVGDRLVVKTGEGTKELEETKIGQSFLNFIKAAGLEGYGRNREKYAGEKWLDEVGNVRTNEGSYVYSLMDDLAKSLAFKNTVKTKDKTFNQEHLLRYQYNLGRNETPELPIGPARDASFFLNWTKEGRAITQEYRDKRNKIIFSHMTESDRDAYNKYVQMYNNSTGRDKENARQSMNNILNKVETALMKQEEWAEVITKLDKEYESMGYSGFQQLVQNGTIKTQEEMNTVMNLFNSDRFNSAISTAKGYIDLGTVNEKGDKGGVERRVTFVDEDKTARGLTMSEMRGKLVNYGTYKKKKIINVVPVKNTGLPLDFDKTSRNLVANGSMVDVLIYMEGVKDPLPATFYAPEFVFDIN